MLIWFYFCVQSYLQLELYKGTKGKKGRGKEEREERRGEGRRSVGLNFKCIRDQHHHCIYDENIAPIICKAYRYPDVPLVLFSSLS